MLRGNWHDIVKVAGLATLIVIGSLLTYTLTVPHGRALQQEAANRADIQSQNAEDRIKWVCSSPKASPVCVAETRQTEAENRRDEEDLGAQKISAWWAQVMGIAALIGMGLSALGVWLIKTTFNETQRANEIASDTMQRQLRAYIKIEPTTGGPDDAPGFYVSLAVINSGQTPALNCESYCRPRFEKIDWVLEDSQGPVPSGSTDTVFHSGTPSRLRVPTPIGPDELAKINANTHAVFVIAGMLYDDVFGHQHRTQIALRIDDTHLGKGRSAACRFGNIAT